MADSDILDRLYQVIRGRKGADPATSYTAKLFSKGGAKIAQKVGEEAVELVIEAARERRDGIAEESADLLYHLLVLWAHAGLTPAEVYRILAAREGTGGLVEKAGREK